MLIKTKSVAVRASEVLSIGSVVEQTDQVMVEEPEYRIIQHFWGNHERVKVKEAVFKDVKEYVFRIDMIDSSVSDYFCRHSNREEAEKDREQAVAALETFLNVQR